MGIETADLRTQIQALAANLERTPAHTTYLALAPIVGQLQGLTHDAERDAKPPATLSEAETSLADLKACMRRVGLDIRLASEDGLRMGLRSALELALAVLTALDGIDPGTVA